MKSFGLFLLILAFSNLRAGANEYCQSELSELLLVTINATEAATREDDNDTLAVTWKKSIEFSVSNQGSAAEIKSARKLEQHHRSLSNTNKKKRIELADKMAKKKKTFMEECL